MISAGGKYWPEAGSGAAIATSARPAANRTAFAFMDALLVCDLPVAPRDLPKREPAETIPSGAALPNSPIRGARCASERRLASLDRSETISAHRPEGPFEALSYHILRKKGNSPIAARKMKATRISRVHGPRRSQQANGRANIIATRRLPGGQPQQRMWRGGRDAAITSAPELARAARLPPSGRRAGA